MIFFETSRLILRQWKEEDLIPYREMNADPQVMRYFPSVMTPEASDGQARRLQEHIELEGWGLWAVEVKSTGEFIGFTGFSIPGFKAFFTPAVEIGWRLKKKVWGRGYAPEAALGALKYRDETPLPFRDVVSFTSALNQPSIRVMEKINLSFLGRFEHPGITEGHPLRPHVVYTSSHGL